MDRVDIREMFLSDVVGGTSLEEDTIDRILDQALKLLHRLTGHLGIDFVSDEPIILVHCMQYYYDLIQRNFETAKENMKSLKEEAIQLHHDYVQKEQADFVNYMGDRT